MTYYGLYKDANRLLDKSKISLGEYERMIEPLNDEVRKVGKWERTPYKRQGHEEVVIEGYSWRCSNCGDARKRNEPDMNFCPNCGAKMEGRTDDD